MTILNDGVTSQHDIGDIEPATDLASCHLRRRGCARPGDASHGAHLRWAPHQRPPAGRCAHCQWTCSPAPSSRAALHSLFDVCCVRYFCLQSMLACPSIWRRTQGPTLMQLILPKLRCQLHHGSALQLPDKPDSAEEANYPPAV